MRTGFCVTLVGVVGGMVVAASRANAQSIDADRVRAVEPETLAPAHARPHRPPAFATDAVTSLQEEAISNYRAGQYGRAARRYEELVKLQPENVEFLRDLMWVLWKAGRVAEAAKVATRITARQGTDLEAWNLFGSAMVKLGKLPEALAAFETSLRLNPEQFSVWRDVSLLLVERRQYDEARTVVSQLLARDPQHTDLYPLLARAQTLQGDFPEAANTWAKVLQLFPDNPAYQYQEASALYHSGQTEHAVTSLQMLITQYQEELDDPQFLQLWRVVAQLAMDLQQYRQASTLLSQLVDRYPQETELFPLLARVQTAQGMFRDAAMSWAKAYHAFPDHLNYHYQEAVASHANGQDDHALKVLQEFVRVHHRQLLDAEYMPVWRDVTRLALDLRAYPVAKQVLLPLLSHDPEARDLYPLLARTHMLQGEFAEAANTWAYVHQLFPDNLAYQYQEASALYHSGQTEHAVANLQQLISQHHEELNDLGALPVWRTIVQLALDLRQYDQAGALLTQLLVLFPKETELYVLLARTQTMQGDFAQAANSWAQVSRFFPDNPAYSYQEAVALSHSGKPEQAVSMLETMMESHPEYDPGLSLLVNQAIVRGDWDEAIRALERRLANPAPKDEPFLFRLADIYHHVGDPKRYVSTLDRYLKLNPSKGEVLLLKAEHDKATHHLHAAATYYKKVLTMNPWSIKALTGLSDLYHITGRSGKAIELIRRVRQLDPTDPYLMLEQARYLYGVGNFKASKRLMTEWLHANHGPILLTLGYHGLVSSLEDPLLASPIHMTAHAFEEQIRTLKETGFTPVTTEDVRAWYQGTLELPEHPVLITFDDARLDSFEHADPILARYGFKATMFVPLVNVERNLPGYASWDQVARYQRTGRWEIQAHGAYAHLSIPIDAEGRTGLFLLNRQWLKDEQRLETSTEWKNRIAADYRLSQATIHTHLGTTPMAYAYPESDFGQMSVPNVPEAAPTNLKLTRDVFGLTFRQDSHGLNVRSKDPLLLTRLEPPVFSPAHRLLEHVAYHSPFTLMYLTLARQAMWEGRFREARKWLACLQGEQVPEALMLVEHARLNFIADNPRAGRALLNQTVQMAPSPDILQIAEDVREGNPTWVWAPSVSFHQDNRHRQSVVGGQDVGSWTIGPTLWRLRHRSGWFHESGVSDVIASGGGLGTTINLGLFHQVSADVLGHWFSGDTATGITALGSLRSRWLDSFTTDVEVGHTPVETARALNAGVRDRYVSLRGDVKPQGLWRASASAKLSSLSDDNTRYTAIAETSTGLGMLLPSVRLMYRFTFDHTQQVSLNYYSPRQLMLHQVGPEWHAQFWEGFELFARYLPGYGQEEASRAQFSQELELEAPIWWRKKISFRPTFSMSRTPSYQSSQVGLKLQFRF
ncbi:MAG: tetratricopeptide repeat protein [Elusimicrobia bacterium]|nr:tetratricopeptide repeat protein [Elusimicrobiota bacterium]